MNAHRHRVLGRTLSQHEDHQKDSYYSHDRDDYKDPDHPFISALLMILGFFDMLMCLLSVCLYLFHLLIDADKLLSLLSSLYVESLGNLVNVVHQVLHCIEFVLALVNDIFKVLSLLQLLDFDLFSLKLLLLLEILRCLWRKYFASQQPIQKRHKLRQTFNPKNSTYVALRL
jgi:hypothetical protein